ncbi:MAG: hypothetical protein J5I90_03540 [Caldilineales bacterium]|nr:hypothetical protein [Caldilineales bacterium]
MTDKSSFTESEWQILKEAPMLAGTAIMLAGKSQKGSSRERWTLIQATAAAGEDYPTNSLIQALLSAGEWDESEQDAFNSEYAGMEPAAIRSDVTEKCRQAAGLVDMKATAGESKDYRTWVYSVAVAVAKSDKEGGFLGIGGERVSEPERETLAALAEALGVDAG